MLVDAIAALVLGSATVGISYLLLRVLAGRAFTAGATCLAPTHAAALGGATALAIFVLLHTAQLPWPLALVCSGWVVGLAAALDVDLRTGYIPDALTAPMAVLALVVAGLGHNPGLPGAVVGGAVGGGLLGIVALMGSVAYRRRALGLGDVKLAAVLGLVLGWEWVLFALAVAGILGALGALLLLALRRASRHSTLPYGPYLAMGGYLALLLAGR